MFYKLIKLTWIGVRPFLYDNDGNLLPNQPTLNKTSLNPFSPVNKSILVEMKNLLMDIPGKYASLWGNRDTRKMSTRILVSTLNNISPNSFIPEAHPLNEQAYFTHFGDWKSHYYCDKK